MRTRRTTRRAQVLQAHAVVKGVLLSTLARLNTPAMSSDATGGWPCVHYLPCVSSRAHHPAHYSAHGHMQRRALMRALVDVYVRNVAYAHSTSLTRSQSDTLVRTRAHAHSQPDRRHHTHRRDITGKTHRHTHAHSNEHTYFNKPLPTYTRTHMNTHEHTKEHARTHTYTRTHTHTHAHTGS